MDGWRTTLSANVSLSACLSWQGLNLEAVISPINTFQLSITDY